MTKEEREAFLALYKPESYHNMIISVSHTEEGDCFYGNLFQYQDCFGGLGDDIESAIYYAAKDNPGCEVAILDPFEGHHKIIYQSKNTTL